MSMPAAKRHWTIADVHALPDDGNRYEVIDGALFVTPAPSWLHQDAVLQLARILGDYLEAESVGHVLVAPADVIFAPDRAVQPDLFVIPLVNGRTPQRWEDVRRLLLAIEVLSPSSSRADRVEKRRLYGDEGVPEYWLVDVDARTFERSTPGDVRIEVLTEQLAWQPEGAAAPLVVSLPRYFSRVTGGE